MSHPSLITDRTTTGDIMRRALLCLPLLLLAACAGTTPTADTPPTAGSAPATVEGLDPADCQSPGFAEMYAEFCYGGGYVDDVGEWVAEGPVDAAVTWPDGLSAELVDVTAGPPSMTNTEPGDDTEVHVTVELSNTGPDTIKLADTTLTIVERLAYGANRYDAQTWFSETGGSDELPAQLVPGTSATTTSTFTLPAAGLDELAFTINPDASLYPEYTFTDVQTLLN